MQGLGMVSIFIFYIINYIYLLYMRTHKADVLAVDRWNTKWFR